MGDRDSGRDRTPSSPRPGTPGVLAAALLTSTALVRVPVEIYGSSPRDFAGGSQGLLLAILGAGAAVFCLLALFVVLLPRTVKPLAGTVLVGLAMYAWTRAGFFPGPSVNLDGAPVTTDLSTGAAGLLLPLSGAVVSAWLARRQARVATAFLAVLVGGSVVQSIGVAASARSGGASRPAGAVATAFEWSRKGNVLILILDSLQSDVFEEVLEAEPELRERLDGFRYYRYASSSSPTTYLSLPTIHGGRHYDPGESAAAFSHESVYEGSVLNRLAGAGYRVSYAMGIDSCPKAVPVCLETAALGRTRRGVAVRNALYLLDLGIYRVLPDSLRRAVLEDGRGVLAAMLGRPHLVDRIEGEAAALERIVASSTVTDSPPSAKMIHSMITHPPLVLQADCSTGRFEGDREGAREGARLQATCAFRRVGALFERLKAEGVYDVSSILVIADHGYGFESRFAGGQDGRFRRLVGAFNPIVLVKPAGSHGRLSTSDAPVDLADLPKALCGDSGCSPAEGLRLLDHVERGRLRPAFWYNWKHEYWALPRIPGLTRYSIRGDIPRIESWSREAATYAPGTALDFRRGRQNSAPYLGFGWARRQRTHQAMLDDRASLFLQLDHPPDRDCVLTLDGLVSGGAPGAPGRVEVEVNGVAVGDVVSNPRGDFETYQLRVPRDALRRSAVTTIAFSSKSAGANGGASDSRLGLQTLELRPLP